MDWNVKNALSRDVEREHLNKILKEIRAAYDALVTRVSDTISGAIDYVKVITGGNQRGVRVAYNPVSKAIDFTTDPFTINITGAVSGSGRVESNSNVTIATSLNAGSGVEEAPNTGDAYWRRNEVWEQVPYQLDGLTDLEPPGIIVIDDEGFWYAREIEGTADQIDVVNGDGTAANPVVSLADLANTGAGTSPVKIYTRDAKGRIEGDEDADTDDLPEGAANLYFTDERAQDAVGTILTDSAEIDFTYDDGVPSISASIVAGSIDETKLDASVNASLVLADSSLQPGDNISELVNDVGFLESVVAGTNVTIDTTDPLNPIINATGGGGSGTVTSVAIAGTDGIEVDSGSPITTSGTIQLGLDATVLGQLADAATAVQPSDNVSVLTNDAGYVDAAGAQTAVVIDSIADSDTTHAPSRNAVFDALALKADNSTVVHLAGVENITGAKTFSSVPSFPSQTAKTVFSAPNGSSGVPTFRQLQTSDLSDAASGAWTATVTAVNNVTSISAVAGRYMQIGDTVSVSGQFVVVPTTSSGVTSVRISLPFAATLVNNAAAAGVAYTSNSSTGAFVASGFVRADSTNNELHLQFETTSAGSCAVRYVAQYTAS